MNRQHMPQTERSKPIQNTNLQAETAADDARTPSALTKNQQSVVAMQQTQGNQSVQRYLAGQNAIQRDGDDELPNQMPAPDTQDVKPGEDRDSSSNLPNTMPKPDELEEAS